MSTSSGNPHGPLTPRERDVLTLLCRQGMSDEEAGRELGIAARTVHQHVAGIRDRLGIPCEGRRRWLLPVSYLLGYEAGKRDAEARHAR